MPVSETSAVERIARILAGQRLSANAEGYLASAGDVVNDEWRTHLDDARAAVEANFRFLGSDNVQISAKQGLDDGEWALVGKILSYEDGLRMPGAVELVKRVEMSISGLGKVRYGRMALDMSVTGTTADALETLVTGGQVQPVNWPEGELLSAAAFIGQGRFFTAAEVLSEASVCVLGY